MERHALFTAFLLAALLVCGCDGRMEQQLSEVRAQAEALSEKHDQAVAEKKELRSELETLRALNETLRSDIEELQERAKSLDEVQSKLTGSQRRVAELEEKLAETAEERAVPAEKSPEDEAGLQKVKARLELLGADLFRRHEYGAARAALLSARELGSDSPAAAFRLAYCETALGKLEEALENYQACRAILDSALESDEELLKKCLVNQGVALAKLGRFQEAAELYEKALSVDPQYSPAHFNLGLLYAGELGEPEQAVESFRKHIANGGGRSVSARKMIREIQQGSDAE